MQGIVIFKNLTKKSKNMNPIKIIQKYYDINSELYKVLITHSKLVTKKALDAAKHVNPLPDLKFIEEAAMLHDIGVYLTNAPQINCHGKEPYIRHCILGRKILEKEGLPRHAIACERHIGVGITKQEITRKNLPLPKRDMVPLTIEEEVVAYADNFFSKDEPTKEISIQKIKKNLARFGDDKVKKFEEWNKKFS